jgi:hypothetical protein
MTSTTSTKLSHKNQSYLWFIIFGFLAVIVIGYIIHKYLEGFTTTAPSTTAALTTTTAPSTTKPPKLFDIVYNTTTTATTVPNVVKSGSLTNQRGNVIYYANTNQHTVNPIADSSEYGTKGMKNVITISLGTDNQPFIIRQIYISKFNSDATKTCNVRVSAVDTKNNQVQFAGLTYNLVNQGDQVSGNGSLEASEVMYNRITQLADPGSGIYLDDVKTMFGTDLIGNKINIFTDSDSVTVASLGEIIITGYSEAQKISLEQLQNTPDTDANKLLDGKQVVIRAIKLSKGSNGTKFRLTYTSPYSNNLFTYPGPVDGQFIYTNIAPTIYLSKMLLTNTQPTIVDSATNGITIDKYNYSDQVSQGDVTKFRMENNLTDLRGSINPEYVCPDIQGLISKHLDAETIVDSIEYLDKINTEKVKLSSNKDNLLTLLEQEEDIKKLELMVKKIRELQAKRTQETDALAALQFTKQINEVMRLRESIEQRIAQRNRNRLDIDISVTDADAAAAQGTPDARDTYKIS